MSLDKQKTLEKKVVKHSTGDRLWSLITFLPYTLPAAIASFSIIAISLLLIGQLRNILIWPIGLGVALLVFIYVNDALSRANPDLSKEKKIFGALVLIGVSMWALFNFHFNSQNIFVYRDPAVYTVASEWIAKHDNLDIEQPGWYTEDIVTKKSAGFSNVPEEPNRVYPQGQHMLPILTGLTNRIVGSSKSLDTNIAIAAVALLAVYGFGALIMRPRWAALASGTLSLSLPMIYFSRDMFTEPLTMLYIFGGMSLILLSLKFQLGKFFWLIGGASFASAALVRTDAFIPIIALIMWALIILTVTRKSILLPVASNFVFLGIGVLIPCILGFFDLSLLSRQTYSTASKSLLYIQILTLILLVIVAIYLYVLSSWRTYVAKLISKISPYTSLILSLIFVLIICVIMTRPYWAHQKDIYSTKYIAGREAIITTPANSTSPKAENLATQLYWYLGPVLLILGGFGILICAIKSFKNKEYFSLLGIFVVVAAAMFYLNIATITPDHIWASRRILPIVIPGIIVFAAVNLGAYYESGKFLRKYRLPIVFVLALALPLGTFQASRYFLFTTSEQGGLNQVNAVCNALPANSITLWIGNMQYEAPLTTKTYCDTQSMGLRTVDKQALGAVYQKSIENGVKPIVGISTSDLAYFSLKYNQFTEVSSLKNKEIEKTFGHLPTKTVDDERTLLLGELRPDGSIRPLK